jgi:hypothetical protein
MTRRIITSAILALAITVMSIWGSFAEIGFPSPDRHLAHLASLANLPGAFVIALLGLGHGPDGFPNHDDVSMYVLTFLMWWGAIYGVRAWWTSRK